MKALVKAKSERGLWMLDVPEPSLGPDDVLIRVHQTGIRGTDFHIYEWDAWAQKTIKVPMVVGHEFVGEVVAFGSNVGDFQVGELRGRGRSSGVPSVQVRIIQSTQKPRSLCILRRLTP